MGAGDGEWSDVSGAGASETIGQLIKEEKSR